VKIFALPLIKGQTKNLANLVPSSEGSAVEPMPESCAMLIPWEHTEQRTWAKSSVQKDRAMPMSFAERMSSAVWFVGFLRSLQFRTSLLALEVYLTDPCTKLLEFCLWKFV